MWVHFLGQEDPLEKERATHSSVLAWRIPQTKDPIGLYSKGSDVTEQLHTHTHTHTFSRCSVQAKDLGLVVLQHMGS